MVFVPDRSIARVRPPLSPRRRWIGWAGLVSVLLHGALLGGWLLWARDHPHRAALVVPVHPATVQLVMSPPGSDHNAPTTLPSAKGPRTAPGKPLPPTPARTADQKPPPPPKPAKTARQKTPQPATPAKTVQQKPPQPAEADKRAEQKPATPSPPEKPVEPKPPNPQPVQTASLPPQPQPSHVASAPAQPGPSPIASAPPQPEPRPIASPPPQPEPSQTASAPPQTEPTPAAHAAEASPRPVQPEPETPPTASATPALSPQPFKLSLGALESDTNALVTGDTVVPPSPDIKFRNRKPSYPSEAVLHGEQGAVVLLVHVRPDGLVRSVEVARSSGYRTLDDSARETVESWHFLPSVQDGQPVAADVPIRIVYALDN